MNNATDFNLLSPAIGELSFISSTVPSCNLSGDSSPEAHDSNVPVRVCVCVCETVSMNEDGSRSDK